MSQIARPSHEGTSILDRVAENFLQHQLYIDDIQFGFMPGRGTTDAILIVRQLQEKCHDANKALYMAFVDLKKAFYRVITMTS